MPKDEKKLQSEFGGDLGSKEQLAITPPSDDYPRIISQVGRKEAVEKTISPTVTGTRDDPGFDSLSTPETNLHDQYVDVNAIEITPRS